MKTSVPFFYGLALACLPLLSSAQRDSSAFQPALRIGLQAAMHWNEVDFSPSRDQKNYPGQGLSLVLAYSNQPRLGVQVEFSLDERGWREQIDSLENQYERKISYFSFSPLPLVALGKGAIKPLIMAGPYLSIPLSSEESIPDGWPIRAHYGSSFTQRLGYGITGGLGVQANFGQLSIQAEGRYRTGFSSIFPLGQSGINFSEPTAWEVRAGIFWQLNP